MKEVPFLEARGVHEREDGPRSFIEDLYLHFKCGIVFCNDRIFIMGRPVALDAPDEMIVDPSVTFADPDCWHVYLAAGELSEFFKVMPYSLPYVSWERNNRLKRYNLNLIREKCLNVKDPFPAAFIIQ